MDKFNVGDKVRVIRPYWEDGNASSITGSLLTGDVVEIADSRDEDGDYAIRTDGGIYYSVGESNLELVEDEPAKTSIGTATFDVEVRFLIGGQDVTDRLRTLFA